MPPPFDPETVLIVGVVGGIFAAATYVLYKIADEQGGKLRFLPEPPPFSLPAQTRAPSRREVE